MADIREGFVELDAEEAIRTIVGGMLKDVWTSLPVTVSEDSDGHTVSVQPSIKGLIRKPDGKTEYVSLPVLSEVPIHFPGGGGATLTHPVKKGDEGIVVFMCRNQDQVQQNGGVQQAGDIRTHSMSDARYIPGGRNDTRKLTNISTASTQLRSDDGNHFVDLHPTTGITHRVKTGAQEHKVTLSSAGVKITSPVALAVEAPTSLKGGTGVSEGNFTFETLSGQSGSYTGAVTAAAFTLSSDARAKEKVAAVTVGRAKARLMALRVVEYVYKATGLFGRGVIAQEAGDQYPHAVHADDEGSLSFDYQAPLPDVIVLLQDAIQRIGQIEKRLTMLERKA